jgi:hypothetical protein
MIPHSTVRNLLTWNEDDREAARRSLESEMVGYARRQVQLEGLSPNCVEDVIHGTKHHRCRNDGSNCLCICHDPESIKEKVAS